MTYKEQLQTQQWLSKREHILGLRGYKCEKCGSTSNLQVHHTFYINGRKAWEYEDHQLNVLCKNCHFGTHSKSTHKKEVKPSKAIVSYCDTFNYKELKCGFIKYPKDIFWNKCKYMDRLVFAIMAYYGCFSKKSKITYNMAGYIFNISTKNFRQSTKSLYENKVISITKERNVALFKKHTNKYKILHNTKRFCFIPSCVILYDKIDNREKVLFMSCLWNMLSIESGVFTIKDLLSIDTGSNRTWIFEAVKDISTRNHFNWITKNVDGTYSINKEAIFQLDRDMRYEWGKNKETTTK